MKRKRFVSEAWASYEHDVWYSIELHERRELYHTLMCRATEGQVVLAVCLHYLKQGRFYVKIESFADLNRIMDRGSSETDPLWLIDLQFATLLPESSAA